MKIRNLFPLQTLRQLYHVFFGTRVRRNKSGREKTSRRFLRTEQLESRWAPATISFADFSSVSGLTLNGSAAQAGDVLRLTPDEGDQAGSAFFATPFPIPSGTSFSTSFEFFIHGGDGSDGADGFVFMLQNSDAGVNALGDGGGSLGYSDISPSVAVEFDTYSNDEEGPSDNHIAVLTNGDVFDESLGVVEPGFDLNGGAPLFAWIDYKSTTNTLKVYLSDSADKPADPILTSIVNIAGVLSDNDASTYAGFSAGTGGLAEDHDILNWTMTSTVDLVTGGLVASGDFNGDGNMDTVKVLQGNSISVMLGNGNGTFGSAVNYLVGSKPSSVATSDVNNDGNLDLLVTNRSSNNVSVLLGNGDGTFGPAVNSLVGSNPSSVAVCDVSGDGNLDLLVANASSKNVSVLLGNGDGTFDPAVNYLVGKGPSSVVAGDFNGDGSLDMAVANRSSNNVSVLLGNGAGSFGTATNYLVGNAPIFLRAVDFNGDGELDLLTANENSRSLSLLLGNGNGTFGVASNVSLRANASFFALGDLNGDGKLDLVTGNPSSEEIWVYIGNGTGIFHKQRIYNLNANPAFIALADFNGDGALDVIVANSTTGVSLLLNNGTGLLTLV